MSRAASRRRILPLIFQRLADQLAEIERRGLMRRRIAREGPQGPRIVVDGREYLAFCSNDYLGLARESSRRRSTPLCVTESGRVPRTS